MITTRKLYADVVTPDGGVAILYIVETGIGSRNSVQAAVEFYHPSGVAEVRRATRVPASRPSGLPGDVWEFELGFGDDLLHCAVHPVLGPWTPASMKSLSGLTWEVISPRAEVVLRWRKAPRLGPPVWAGTGYIDRVTLRRLPRALGLGSLAWGRAHLPHATVVFTSLSLPRGGEWRAAARWDERGVPEEWQKYTLGDNPDESVLHVPSGDDADRELRLVPQRLLREGQAFDRERLPAPLRRWLTQLAIGPTHERRMLSAATLGLGNGWAVEERVRFGR